MTNPPERLNVPPRPKNSVKEGESPRGRRARVQAKRPKLIKQSIIQTVQGKAANNAEACTAQKLEGETLSCTGVKVNSKGNRQGQEDRNEVDPR